MTSLALENGYYYYSCIAQNLTTDDFNCDKHVAKWVIVGEKRNLKTAAHKLNEFESLRSIAAGIFFFRMSCGYHIHGA